jgi:hypothetical protein
MAKQGQVRQRYLSDLTDEQGVILKPLLPSPRTHHGGAPPWWTCVLFSTRCCIRIGPDVSGICYRTTCSPRVLSTNTLRSGGMTARGPRSSVYCEPASASKKGARRLPVRLASTVNRSRRRKWEVRSGGRMGARKLTGANAMCWSIRLGCCSSS